MTARRRLNPIALIACLIAGIFTCFRLRESTVGLAQVLAVFFTGAGGGALLAASVRDARK